MRLKTYRHTHGRTMATPAVAQMTATMLYGKRLEGIIPRIVNLHLKQPSQSSDQVLPLLHLEHPRRLGQGGEGCRLQLRPGRPL